MATYTPAGYSVVSIDDPTVVEATTSQVTSTATTSSTSFQSDTTTPYSSTSRSPPTTLVTSNSPSSPTTAVTTQAFHYTQIYGKELHEYTITDVNDAPFSDLCPGGDCLKACQDYGLLFDKDHYEFDSTADLPTSFSNDGITLFGLCTNIANITSAVANTNTLPNATDFFQIADSDSYSVNKIVSGTAQCFYGTCQATRHPSECDPLCSTFVLQESISTLNFKNTYKCITKLCDNTCGLPFANQDVFGIGVLASFAVQALIILLYATFCLIRIYDPATIGRKISRVTNRVNTAAGAFLVAECFFAVSAVVAAFRLAPQSIDPLNGYALLFIATIGFIPPVFTLMLLHSQRKSEWYYTFLVLLSWILSSALFFILIQNLQTVRHDNLRVADARNALYQVDACGGYSAMSLCRETGKYDPIHYMMGFFNQDSIPNIDNIPILWVFATIVLLVLLTRRAVTRPHRNSPTTAKIVTSTRYTRAFRNVNKTLRRGLLPLAIILFILCFSYQICMVIRYVKMDLIDKSSHGWTFGQIVALLLWAPVLFELTIGSFLEYVKKRFGTNLDDSGSDTDDDSTNKPPSRPVMSGRPTAQTHTGYQPVPFSPMPMSMPTPTPLLAPSPLIPTNSAPLSPVSVPSSPNLGQAEQAELAHQAHQSEQAVDCLSSRGNYGNGIGWIGVTQDQTEWGPRGNGGG